MNLKLKGKLIGGFSLIALITLFVGLIAIFSLQKIFVSVHSITDETLPCIEILGQAASTLEAMSLAQRSLLITSATREEREGFVKNFYSRREAYLKLLGDYKKIPMGDEEKKLVDELEKNLADWRAKNDEYFELHKLFLENDIMNPMELNRDMEKFQKDHYLVFINVLNAIQTRRVFDGGDDHTACNFGK